MKGLKRYLYTFILILWDVFSVLISLMSACMLSDNKSLFSYFTSYKINPWLFLIAFSVIYILFNFVFKSYGVVLKHFGLADMLRQAVSVIFTGAAFIGFNYIYPVFRDKYIVENSLLYSDNLRKKVLFIAILLLFVLAIIGRSIAKVLNFSVLTVNGSDPSLKRTLIYGAGEAGVYLKSKLENHHDMGLAPIIFIDDNPELIGRRIQGLKVYGNKNSLLEAIDKYKIEHVIVAIPTAPKELIKFVIEECRSTNCTIQRFGELGDAQADLDSVGITNIKYEDLLHRDSVNLNMQTVIDFIKDKTVLVTGGAGSIGSEICKQVLSFGCKKLIVFDINENGLFFIDNALKEKFENDRFVMRLGSIRDKKRLEEVFNEFNPQIVFHAAAHKHVPMMEINPKEAIKNNVFGTYNLALTAIDHKVEKFITISTDKAVNPTNIMGASKRIAELIIQHLDKDGDTEFAAVRFGNVLGSNGSVIPFFQKQISEGGPVTVTHPDMRRYFMTIPEAVQLVLEAGAMAKGGEIFVLDMGEPVKIYDLACDLIKLSGHTPNKDIKIVISGLRPGEKLFEELRIDGERFDKTANNKIFIMKPIKEDGDSFLSQLIDLNNNVNEETEENIFKLVSKIVPTFVHKEN
ncbi:MAG: nucleoside-diphosphate sugar epimerase/dehydratase [Acutalibacteraceae bacterium]|nr:nucleoside-diphosphate sugar epimerase/dehydratase [Acutalibacteraceae bacterium]